MASEELGSMIVRLALDGTDFDKGMKNLGSKMNLANSEFKAASSRVASYGKSIDGLKAKQDALAKMYDLQGKKVRQLRDRYDELVKTQGENSQAALKAGQNLNSSISVYNKLGGQLKDVKGDIDKLNNELNNQPSKWQKAGQAAQTFGKTAGKSLRSVGQTMSLSVTAPIVGLAAAAVKTGMTFDQEMSKVRAISGATGDQLESMRQQAIELGASTTKSSSEVASGMLEMAKAGYDVNAIMAAMPGIISSSEAAGADMAQTAEVMSSALNIFGLEASEASRVADVLAQTANVSAADITDMQYALKYAGPPAAALGISLEELSAAIGIMTNAGMKGEQAGTTLRGALLGLLDPSEENSKLMKQMGVQITDASGNFVGLTKLIGNLEKAMEGQTDTQKAATLASLVGTEAVSGMLSLMEAGPKVIDEMTGSLENSAGSSEKAAKVMKDNFAGALEELKGTLESIGIMVSDDLTPTLKAATEWLAGMGDEFKQLSPEARQTLVVIGLIAAAIGPMVMGLGLAASGIGVVTAGLAALTGPVGLTVLALAGLATGFGLLDKEMDKPILKSDIFKGKISDATKEAVGSYMQLHNDATAELNALAWSQSTITQSMADDMVGKYKAMGDQVLQAMQENHAKQLEEQQSLFDKSNVLTEEEEARRIAKLKADQLKEVEAHNATQARINEIWMTAVEEKRGITEAEGIELAKLGESQRIKAVEELSKSQQEQETILKNLKNNKSIIETESSAETVKKAIETRDKVVKEAEQEYQQRVAQAEEGRDVLGTLKVHEADAMIKEAERTKNQTIAKAEDMHTEVVNEARAQAGEHVNEVNWETGEVLSGWDSMYNGVISAVNWIRGLFDKAPLQKKGTVKETGRQKQRRQDARLQAYATGTPSTGHPGGPAIVSEQGPELIHEPGIGSYLSGNNGPELRYLRRGASVLPNRQTERMLKNYGFPGYAKGIGDYFDLFTKGAGSVWDMVKGKFNLKDATPSWMNRHTGSPLAAIGGMATKWIKNLWDNFFSVDMSAISGSGVQRWSSIAAKALMMTGQYNKANLDRLLFQMKTESGGNPKAINLWDSNAKRGTPSKGLMQVIDPTFKAYAHPSYNKNVWDPMSNILASIRYSLSRYGSLTAAWRGVGYAKGGEITSQQLAMLGENGYKEWVLTSEPRYRDRNLSMWADAGRAMGVPVIPGTGSSEAAMTNMLDYSRLANTIVDAISKRPLEISVNPGNISLKMDNREIAQSVFKPMAELMETNRDRTNRLQGLT